jgi:uncharacterized glyoxalase superfamily protein PhnB
MRYRNVAAAADWLCEAFGFEKQTVLTDDAGATMYAQLTFGRALIMLAPVGNSPIEQYMKQPDEIGGAETQSCYFMVADADAHYAAAKAAGAEIVLPVEDDDFGGRGYTCRDPEGHIWTFGTYDPWQGKFPETAAAAPPEAPARRGGRFMRASLVVAALAAVGVGAWFGGTLTQQGAVIPTAQVPKAAASNNAAQEAAEQAFAQLERERSARAMAEAGLAKASEEAAKRVTEAEKAREAAERAVKEARSELEKERKAKGAATVAAQVPPPDLVKRVEDESRAREAAERAVKEARAELEKERAKTTAATATPPSDAAKRLEEAERSAKQARAELEKAQADRVAAEMAKEFALGRAEEEQAAREAAERAAKEARAALERQQAAKPAAAVPAAADGKALADLRRALDEAKKRSADEQKAREAAEQSAKEVREELAKEQKSKAAAWKVVGQLTKQLKQVKSAAGPSGDAADGGVDDDGAKKAKARPRPKKTPDDIPEQ